MSVPSRDFKYRELIASRGEWSGYMKAIAGVKSEILKPAAEVFRANLDRMAVFAMLPTELSFQIRRDEILFQAAFAKVEGKPAVDWEEIVNRELTAEVAQEIQNQIGKFESLPIEEQHSLRRTLGIGYVERFLDVNRQMQQSMDAIMTFIVLDSWVAFECLASDLWIAAVDNPTNEIAARVIANQKWEKSEALVSGLPQTEFNPKTHPGSFRKEIGLVTFQKLRSIREYFKIAFGDEAVKIIEETADGYVHALSQFRNCITHSAGKVDAQFVRQMARFPEFKSLKMGEKITLSGELVKKLRNAAAETGVALLQHIDGILAQCDPA